MKTLIRLIAVAVALTIPMVAVVGELPDPQQPTSAEALEAKADGLARQKQYSEAAVLFGSAIAQKPNDASLYNKLGMVELQLADYRAAESHFRKAIKLRNSWAEPLNNLGVVYYATSNNGRAISYYKKALALNEANASFHSNLGAAWFGQKKLDKAITEYSRAIELDPDILIRISSNTGVTARIASPKDRAAYAYIMAKLYAKMGDIDRALFSLQKAKEEGYDKLGNVYVDTEFASIRGDQRITNLVPPPQQK